MLDSAEFEFYLDEGEEIPPFQHELRDELFAAAANMVVTLEAIEAITPAFTNHAAWYLQYAALSLQADLYGSRLRFRSHLFRRGVTVLEELPGVARHMRECVAKAAELGGPSHALRCAWFLTYVAVKLAGRYCHRLDATLIRMGAENDAGEQTEGEGAGNDGEC